MGREWTASEIALLGTAHDRDLAARWRVHVNTVRRKRQSLGIAAFVGPWRRQCPRCGVEFATPEPRRQYCSAECKREVDRERMRKPAHKRHHANYLARLTEEERARRREIKRRYNHATKDRYRLREIKKRHPELYAARIAYLRQKGAEYRAKLRAAGRPRLREMSPEEIARFYRAKRAAERDYYREKNALFSALESLALQRDLDSMNAKE